MALSHAKASDVAEFFGDLASDTKALYYRFKEALGHNSALSIDWSAETKPAFLNEDAMGNIDGLQFDREELANAIGSFDAIRSLLESGHLGNLEKLAHADTGSN